MSCLFCAIAAGEIPSKKVYEDEQLIGEKFGRSNMMMAIVPNVSSIDEKLFTDEVEEVPYTKTVVSLDRRPLYFLSRITFENLITIIYVQIPFIKFKRLC